MQLGMSALLTRLPLSTLPLLVLTSLSLTPAGFSADAVIQPGEDWSLPAWVQPAAASGYFAMDSTPGHPLIQHLGKTLTWANLNPGDGIYDFTLLEDYLERARRRGGKVLFRMKSSVYGSPEVGAKGQESKLMPEWVVKKHNPPVFSAGSRKYAAPWHPGVQSEFKRFVEEFGRRGYLASEQLAGVYLHGVSQSAGEEMSIDNGRDARAAGLTADALMACWQARMDWWVEAAGPNIHKVVWVGAGNIGDLPYPREKLDAYALRKGLGHRGGFIERYFYGKIAPPVAGQSYENGYVVSDWRSPSRDGRCFSDEAEEDDEWGNEPFTRNLAAQSSYFRAAQVGLNYLWISPTTLGWAGGAEGIPGWFRLVAGKGPRDSPDAACWLRQASVRGLGSDLSRPWKNMERMLMQRDIPGAITVATNRVAMPYVSNKARDDTDEFLARRTDLAHGQDRIAFRLDPVFKRSLRYPVLIKVTYLDDTPATWTVRAATAGGGSADLGTVIGNNDDAWRTATFVLKQPFSPGTLGADVDFAIVATGTENVTVRYVRVVRTLPPLASGLISERQPVEMPPSTVGQTEPGP